MKKIYCLLLLTLMSCFGFAQINRKTENVIIVTLDGLRWQEVFEGVDSSLMNNKEYNKDSAAMRRDFWSDNVPERRKKLFPFLWTTVAEKGQLYGNRKLNNYVNNANPFWFSYPGYNEIFTGFPDTSVNSNDKIPNKNVNVLEFINKQKGFQGKVAAFTTWDVFPYILNDQRSGIYVNADVDTLAFNTPELKVINDMQFLTTRPVGVRPDLLTYMAAREYLKAYRPRVLYIAFDETDDFAHGGMYDQYIKSAYAEDAMIADLWKTIQSIPQYKDKTTLIITTDHGRGDDVKQQWKDHGQKVKDASEIWIAAMGPDTNAMGELKQSAQLYQRQLATTFSALLGLDFKPGHEVMPPIKTIVEK